LLSLPNSDGAMFLVVVVKSDISSCVLIIMSKLACESN
jgi:hypothetical protein